MKKIKKPYSKATKLGRIATATASLLFVLILAVSPLSLAFNGGWGEPSDFTSKKTSTFSKTNEGGNEVNDSDSKPRYGEVLGGKADPNYVDSSPQAMAPVKLTREQIAAKLASSNQGMGDSTVSKDVPMPDADQSENEGGDYAKTNVQHEGVDEGDIIKVDDGYIYSLSQEGLVIVSVLGNMSIACKIEYDNFYPDEMFIFGNNLIVIGGSYTELSYYNNWDYDCSMEPWYGYRSSTRVIVYDLNDRVKVNKICEYDISGSFVTSRLISGRLIVAVNYYFNQDNVLPIINGHEMSSDNIYVYESDKTSFYSYTILASLDLNTFKANITAHLGLYGLSYFSSSSLYFFNNVSFSETGGDFESGNTSEDLSEYVYRYSYYTNIVKIDLNSLLYHASTRIDGYVNDRYWVDEYQGNLRMVASYYEYVAYWWGGSTWMNYTMLFVLDENLNTLGSITDIASGESVYSVRLNGTEGSIVTYLEVDPLFKLDLSDPTNPQISKGLKEEGVNLYLQYLSDEIVLGLGLGDGFRKIKVSLYDNSGEDAVNVNTMEIGEGIISSEALYNPKAILNDPAKNMFSFVASDYDPTYNAARLKLFSQGLHIFEYDLDASNAGKLVYRGLLSNIERNKVYTDWVDRYDDYFSYIKRGARIGDKIYTISEKYITSYDIYSLNLIQRLQVSNIHYHRLDEGEVIVPSSCRENGNILHRCTYQDCTYSMVSPLYMRGCNFGEWRTTTTPTQTTSGIQTRTCKNDSSHVETRRITNNGLVIELNENNEYIITDTASVPAELVIPAFVDDLPLTGIGQQAFNFKNVRKVTFESGSLMQTIGNYAFANVSALVTIELPSGLKEIGDRAFYGCMGLKSITIPEGVTKIGHYAFHDCMSLSAIIIPKSVTQIGGGAFLDCHKLSSIVIPEGVTQIEYDTFSSCYNLKKVVLPESLLEIGSYAFWGCYSLTSITLPSKLTQIGNGAFWNCEGLASITIPEGVTTIAMYAFYGCRNLRAVQLPSELSEIGYYAFGGCESLAGITLPKNIQKIGGYAFNNCTSLAKIDIPSNVDHLGEGAFQGCTTLTEITVPSKITQINDSTFKNCTTLKQITLPSGIRKIGNYAFTNCTSLTTLTIPSKVVYIGNYAFSSCTSIKEITIPSSVIQICYGAFYNWTQSQTIKIETHTQKPKGWFMDWNTNCQAKIQWPQP